MCGVVGVIGSTEAAKETFLALSTLQHRGQDAGGILSSETIGDEASGDQVFHLNKNTGLVENIFTRESIEQLKGDLAVGHTRYSTVGRGSIQDVQPLVINYPYGIGLVHNGNIVNYTQVKHRLLKEMRRRCFTNSDTETLLNWFAGNLEGSDFDSIEKAVREVFENLHGSYSVVGILGNDGLFAFRDPYGIRPLVIGKKLIDGKPAYMVASETVPLSFSGYEYFRDVQAGELIFIDRNRNLKSKIIRKENPIRPCMFEWVYFASAESEIESTPVYGARLELGRKLGKVIAERLKEKNISLDLVAPVPDTSRTAAITLAQELNLPYREVLIKNRYIKRTFILDSQEKRKQAVDLKMNLVLSEIRGKNILLVDDSIVRGNTSRKIVQMVKKAGAEKVYFVSTCPPIRYPCFYGIDFPDQKELIAAGKTEDEIAKELGADGVIYLDIASLTECLKEVSNGHVQKPCTACLDGKYPTDVSESARFATLRQVDRKSTGGEKH